MKYYPKHLQIETVNKLCNARCPMCTIFSSSRDAEIMSLDKFRMIIERFLPYKEHLDLLTLHGCGEPLLDKTLPEKVVLAKKMGFRGIGFSSNCELLDGEWSKRLLEARLDTFIASIDGITKEVQEKIRAGVHYENVYSNTINYIKLRDKEKYKGRILIRFIRQKLNYDQWDAYYDFWSKYIDFEKGDDIIRFDIHNCAERIDGYEEMVEQRQAFKDDGYKLCPDLFERFIVFASGDVAFCSADQSGYFDFGNIIDSDPLKIFNNRIYNHYRREHLENRQSTLEHCRKCTISNSRYYKQKPKMMRVAE